MKRCIKWGLIAVLSVILALGFIETQVVFADENDEVIIESEDTEEVTEEITEAKGELEENAADLEEDTETEELANHMKLEVFKCINIKYVIFFVLNFILLILFWFYLTCFNGIYANTQIYLIENTFISFGLSLFYPFIWNILPAIFRIFSLNTKKQDRQYSYNFSKILHLI